MSQKVQVYIEIQKHSNIKYEFDKEKNTLVIDRILPYPYYYPYPYGFIPNIEMNSDSELFEKDLESTFKSNVDINRLIQDLWMYEVNFPFIII